MSSNWWQLTYKKMKYTASLAIGLALTAVTSFAEEKIVIKGSDTLGAKMVPQLKEFVAAWDMIAVVVNEANGVRDLTLEQIEGIFTGDITDWSEVGGKAGKITAYTRNTSSGTYKAFQKLAMNKRDYGSTTKKFTGIEEVVNDPNGIGYVGLAYVGKDGLRAIKVNGEAPKRRNKDKYPLSRKLYYYTVGEPAGATKSFLDWCLTDPKAVEVVEAVGFIPAEG